MQWHSVADFFAMGGHAAYVWGSYAVTLTALAAELWKLRRRKLKALEAVKQTHMDE